MKSDFLTRGKWARPAISMSSVPRRGDLAARRAALLLQLAIVDEQIRKTLTKGARR